MKFMLTLLFSGIVSFNSFGQQPEMADLDHELTKGFQEMITADYDLRYDSLAPHFIARLTAELSQAETITFPFDSLSAKIRIIKSTDGKFRTFSWDERSGGSWHNMAAIAQFKTDDGEVKVQQLDTGEEVMRGGYTDVIIYEVHELMINDKIHYLTIGWGTHGSGHHHSIIQVFKIEEDKLVKCDTCFEKEKDLVVIAPRRNRINLKFNPDTLEITHNEFLYEEEIGFYKPQGTIARLKLVDDVFQVQ